MYSPRPPAPIAAAIVAEPTPTTAATRTPATIDGSASGSSTCRSSSRGVMPIATPASRIDRIDAAQPGDRRAHDRQQRRRGSARRARRARRRRRRAAPAAGSRTSPGSESSGRCWRRPSAATPAADGAPRRCRAARRARPRRASSRTTSSTCWPSRRGELGAVREPEREEPVIASGRSASPGRRRAGRRTRGSRRRARSRGRRRSHAISRPSSSTPTRSPSANASPMSCVTMMTVLRSARLDAAELGVQLGARQRIERAERLVHQQHRRIDGQRARDADALPLSARQLVRPARGELPRRQADELEQLVRRAPSTRSGAPALRAAARRRRCRRRTYVGTGRRPAARSRRVAAARSDPTRACRALRRAPRRRRAAAAG